MKSAAWLVDAASMSESATLLDEPKVDTGEAKVPATAPEATDTSTPDVSPPPATAPASAEPGEQSIDALLNEASMLAEAAETSETPETAKTAESTEAAEAAALAKAAIADQPPEAAETPETTAKAPQEPPAPNSEAPAANPWADEVAQLENQWANGEDGTKGGPADAPAEQATAGSETIQTAALASEIESPDTTPVPARRNVLFRVLAPAARMALAGPVLILVALDIPFAKLGPGLKNFIGYVGIATTIVAAACWILAPKVRSMLE